MKARSTARGRPSRSSAPDLIACILPAIAILRTGLPANWFIREIFGIVLVLIYVFALPVVLARTWFKSYYAKMGAPRYYVGAFLFLMMMALPVKMLLRWLFNLKYIVAIGEFFFNI